MLPIVAATPENDPARVLVLRRICVLPDITDKIFDTEGTGAGFVSTHTFRALEYGTGFASWVFRLVLR